MFSCRMVVFWQMNGVDEAFFRNCRLSVGREGQKARFSSSTATSCLSKDRELNSAKLTKLMTTLVFESVN